MRPKQNGAPAAQRAISPIQDKGRGPLRPQGEEVEEEPQQQQRAISPEQQRARSPNAFSSNRAASPAGDSYGQSLGMAGAAAMNMNGINGTAPRAASPQGVYYSQPSSSATPNGNGYGHGGRGGSAGNVAGDLLRELKEKEAEMDAMKKKEAWMKAALAKATRSGFVYADSEQLGPNSEDDDIDGRKISEMVINLKHLKAKLEVRETRLFISLKLSGQLLTDVWLCRPPLLSKLSKHQTVSTKRRRCALVQCKKPRTIVPNLRRSKRLPCPKLRVWTRTELETSNVS